jgi:hypothetical protein
MGVFLFFNFFYCLTHIFPLKSMNDRPAPVLP